MSDFRHGRNLGTLILLICACACSPELTPERARAEIDELGVPFDEAGILNAIGSRDNELLGLFLAAGFDPNRRDPSMPAPLALAAARANLPAVKMMIAAGAGAAEIPGILAVPAERGNVAMLEVLLDAGAEIDAPDHQRRNAIMAATRRDRTDALRLLLDRGADPDGRPGGSGRPLLTAVELNSLDSIELLVGAGANVDIIGRSPVTTPLTLAARLGHEDAVEFLLAHGADPSRAVDGMVAARAARQAGHEELAERLEQAASN